MSLIDTNIAPVIDPERRCSNCRHSFSYGGNLCCNPANRCMNYSGFTLNTPIMPQGEEEVDVINPLTPEIRCSNCIHSSDNRGEDGIAVIVICNNCNDHSNFVLTPLCSYTDSDPLIFHSVAINPPFAPNIPEINCSNCRYHSDHSVSSDCFSCVNYSRFTPNTPVMPLKDTQMPLEAIKRQSVGNAIDGLEI